MKSKTFLIFDPEEGYAEKLAALLSKEDLDFRFRAFTDPEKLLAAAREEPAEILLASETGFPVERRQEYVKALQEKTRRLLYFGAETEEEEEIPHISKYQSCRQIFRHVMAKIHRAKSDGAFLREEAFRVGVYSPAGGCGKSRLARRLALMFAEREKTLRLSMEPFSDERNGAEGGNVADCLYYRRQGRLDAGLWASLCPPQKDVDFLGPPLNPEDLEEVSAQELVQFYSQASDYGYEKVVVDAGCRFPAIEAVFTWCDVVAVPENGASGGKWEQFLRYLRGTGREDWEDKLWIVKNAGTEGSREEMEALRQQWKAEKNRRKSLSGAENGS